MTTIEVDATPQEIIDAMHAGWRAVSQPFQHTLTQIRDAAAKQLPEPLKVGDVVKGNTAYQPLRIVTELRGNGKMMTWCAEFGKVLNDQHSFNLVEEA